MGRSFALRRSLVAIGLLLCVAAALALRVVPGFAHVFPPPPAAGEPSPVLFREVDPWYHVRAIEHQVANFPERFAFDPYRGFPDGGDVPVAPLFDWTVAAAALIAGAGRPGSRTVEVVAAWAPAVLGALTVLPVALLAFRIAPARRPVAALFAGGLFAILPGQHLARSLLGFTDHHVLEALLATALLAALVAAFDERRSARQRRLSTALAGFALLGLLLAWVGAASVVLVLALFFGARFAVDVAARRPLLWLEQVAIPALAIALIGVFLLHDGIVVPDRNLVATAGALAGAAGLALAARLGARFGERSGSRAERRRLGPRAAIALSTLLLVALAAGVAAWLAPGLAAGAVAELDRFVRPGELAATVLEAGSLAALGPLGAVLWSEFALAGPLAAMSLLALVALWAARRGVPAPGELLLLVWSCGFLLLAVRQNRFLYYLAAPVAVAAALAIARLDDVVARRLPAAALEPRRPGDRRERLGRGLILAGIAVAACALSLRPALWRAQSWSGPSADWRETLHWLRQSTPEPFEDATHYWRAVTRDAADRPRPSYAVGAWWDYGYWILRGAHRVPAADPTQAGAGAMARLLLSQSDVAAAALADAAGVRYVVVDAALPVLLRGPSRLPSGKLSAIARWAGEPSERFYEKVERREADGTLRPYTIFHPDYYRTLLVRLFLFAGRRVEPTGTSYVAELAPAVAGGLRELVRIESYPSLGAAQTALAGRDPRRFALVGLDPMVPCVPLPASTRFRRVHGSPTPLLTIGDRKVSEVELFERVDEPASAAGSGV